MTSALRVLHLINDLGKGGAQRFVSGLCCALNERPDVEARIGALYPENEYREATRTTPIVVLGYEPHSILRRTECPEYRRLLEDFRPQVIHTNLFLAEFLSAQHVQADAVYVCHGHDNMWQFEPLSGWDLLRREKLLPRYEVLLLRARKYARTRTYFVANSQHTAEYYRRTLPRAMQRDVRLIPYGFEFQRFFRELPRASAQGGPLRLVNVASFQKKKNQGFLLDVAEALDRRGVAFELHLLGDGETRAQLEAATRERGLASRVCFHGNVDGVEQWLWRSDVYVHAAVYEPFGLVFLEAMAAGLPIVSMDGKGNRDIVRSGVNGFLMQTPDPVLFAEKLLQIWRSPDLAAQLADNGQRQARDFDMRPRADAFVDFYRSILAADHRGPLARSLARMRGR